MDTIGLPIHSQSLSTAGIVLPMARQPDPLEAPPSDDLGFTYRVRKNHDVEVLHRGRLATTLRGAAAAEFLSEVGAGFADGQQVMARVTGNYKRGNERTAAKHPRNRR